MFTKISEITKSLITIVLLIFAVSAHAQESDGSFKVITYNIWNGYDWGKDEVRRAEVAENGLTDRSHLSWPCRNSVYTPQKNLRKMPGHGDTHILYF